MARGVPGECPKCGSHQVGKERILGAQTGDWICGDCGETGQLNGVPIGTVVPEPIPEKKKINSC